MKLMKIELNRKTILITLAAIAALYFIITYAGDVILSFKLSHDMQVPVKIRRVNFSIDKVLSGQELKIGYLGIGEPEVRANLEKIKIFDISKNKAKPDHCIDGKVSFNKIYIGRHRNGNCDGGFRFKCIPYNQKTKQLAIRIKDIAIKTGDGLLSSGANINSPDGKRTNVSAFGSMSKSNLNQLASCLNGEKGDDKAMIEVPNFSVSLYGDEKITPDQTFKATGNFAFYQAKFSFWDKLKPLLEKSNLMKISKQDNADNFDKLTGGFNVDANKIALNNLDMATSIFRIQGRGEVDYENNIDFRLAFAALDRYLPTKTFKVDSLLPGGLIPFKVTGTVEKPKVATNFAGIHENLTPKIIKEQVNGLGKLLGIAN